MCELFVLSIGDLLDYAVGDIKDWWLGASIPDQRFEGERIIGQDGLVRELSNVFDVRTLKSEDGLVIVADHKELGRLRLDQVED